jgi:hypothetical protein
VWRAVASTRDSPAKMELWFSSKKDENAIAKISPEILRPVAGQHLHGDEIHRSLPNGGLGWSHAD